MMKAEVLSWCRSLSLFSEGDRVICAVSGGADSMAMLWCLRSLQNELGICVSAAHFNHCLRAEESDRDERFVAEFCAKHKIPLFTGRADVAEYAVRSGKSIEDAAREKRYAFLQSLPCDKLATAHTADDNAETVLLHILRGSGLRGLCGIPPKRGKIVRPLLSVDREQILAYLKEENLSWCEDSSNALDACSRNRLRHHVLPLLREEEPNFSQMLLRQSALLREEDALLDEMAAKLLRHPEGAPNLWLVAPILHAPNALQKRALRLIVRQYLPKNVSMKHIEALRALLKATNPSAQLSLPEGLTARRCYDAIEITRQTSFCLPETALNVSGSTELTPIGMTVECRMVESFEKYANTPFQFAIKYDMMSADPLYVRSRRRGDTIITQGGCRRTLKKLLIDRKIPRSERERLAVVTDGAQVLAVAGLGVSQNHRAVIGAPALLLRFEQKEK